MKITISYKAKLSIDGQDWKWHNITHTIDSETLQTIRFGYEPIEEKKPE